MFYQEVIGYAEAMDIRSYIERLRDQGELYDVEGEIDARLEFSALTDLACKHNGPGLLFSKVRGSSIPVATNLFGSDYRMAQALGYESLDAFGTELRLTLLAAKGATSEQRLQGLLKDLPSENLSAERSIQPVDLDLLPEIRFWPAEERSFLTLAVVISRAPKSSEQNYGLYRVGIVDKNRLTLNLLPGSGAGQHLKLWRAEGKPMPVAIMLGADPALIFAAAAPLPQSCNEEHFSAYLTRSSIRSSPCHSVPLSCPVSAQVVIEGWVDAEATLNEGLFGCYTGDYGGSNDAAVVVASSLAMVAEPLLPLTLAGPLPMEDCWIAKANLEIIRARLAVDLPQISLIEMPLTAAFHGVYFVRSHERSATVDALARRMRRLDYLRGIKLLILLDGNDPGISDLNWRKLLRETPAAQIWQAQSEDLSALLSDQPQKLQPDHQLQRRLLQRLRIGLTEITAQEG